MTPEDIQRSLACIESQLVALRSERRALRAALRAASGGTPRARRLLKALQVELASGPMTTSELHDALRAKRMRWPGDRNVRRTYLYTILNRNPVLFGREDDGRWKLQPNRGGRVAIQAPMDSPPGASAPRGPR
jgi:hypothetical protein